MKKFILLFALISLNTETKAQVSDEDLGKFMAAGAIVSFHELCNKIYPDTEKFEFWTKVNIKGENKASSADPYREEKTDRVFLVGSNLASFVVSFAKNGTRCTLYGHNADRVETDRLLKKTMTEYGAKWKTQYKLEKQYKPRKNEEVFWYMAYDPKTNQPLHGISISYIISKERSSLLKISAIHPPRD